MTETSGSCSTNIHSPLSPTSDGIRRLRRWLDSNLDEFRPTLRDVPLLEDFKPLVELGLVLYGLTGRRKVTLCPESARWANRTAEALWAYVETFGRDIDWRGLTAVVAERPDASLTVMPFLLFEALTGQTSAVHHEASVVLSAVNAVGAFDLDLAFMLDIAALRSCEEQAVKELRRYWMASPAADHNIAESSSAYELTHFIFYATKMGRHMPAWHKTLEVWLVGKLGCVAESALRKGDLDLGAELLLSMAWAGDRHSPAFRSGIDVLATAAASDAGIPLYEWSSDPDSGDFRNRYHATLVVLAALSEAAFGEPDL
jgi:hypothetical protein